MSTIHYYPEILKQLQETVDELRRRKERKNLVNWGYLLKHRCINVIIKEKEQNENNEY